MILRTAVPPVSTLVWTLVYAPRPRTVRHPAQKAYRLRAVAAGRCARCTKMRERYRWNCDACQAMLRVRQREWNRKKFGYTPWTPGQRGRPPLEART